MPRAGQRQPQAVRDAIATAVAAKWRDPMWRQEHEKAVAHGRRITQARRAAAAMKGKPT
jgi:endonuclease III